MGLATWWNDFTNRGLAPGIHGYTGAGQFKGHRFHLRVDGEQKGVLMVDANKLLFLNGTALDYVRCILEGRDDKKTETYMRRRYRGLDARKSRRHLREVRAQFKDFLEGKNAVISSIGPDNYNAAADGMEAPYRMDLALTYECSNDCGHCYNEGKDQKKLTFAQWRQVLEKLWKVGVPHVVFTGGEPTLNGNLPSLIAAAQDIGQVTGLITNGRKLREKGYLAGLVNAGLDHVQITLLSHRETVHDTLTASKGSWMETVEGIRVSVKEDLYTSTNTTIMASNADEMEDTLKFIISLGVKNVSFNGIIRSGKGKTAEAIDIKKLEQLLKNLKAVADAGAVKLVWYSPTAYCELNPVNLGLGIRQCTACSINMAIEPDGTVIPCQSCYEPVGNILKDEWSTIWNHKLCKNFRGRKYVPGKCKKCAQLNLCGGGCPLSYKKGEYICTDRDSN